MKNLLFLIAVLFSLSAAAQSDTLYCVQIISTQNPQLLRPEMISILPDSAMVEYTGSTYRIMFVYPDYEQAMIAHSSWIKQHSGAFITKRTRKQVKQFYNLYTYE